MVFLLCLFSLNTPPAVLSLHLSCCVLLTPETFVSFDSSSSLLFPLPALCSYDLLQHSSVCLPSPFFVPHSFLPHLILQFLPSPTYPLYSFHIAFPPDLFFRNMLSFHSHFPSVSLVSRVLFPSPNFSLITPQFLPALHSVWILFHSLLHIPCVMRFFTPCIYGTRPRLLFFVTVNLHHLLISTYSFYLAKHLGLEKTMIGLTQGKLALYIL